MASLGGAPMALGNAEVAATLKDGVLTVSRFKGGLYGGTISLAGVVDGREPSLSFDFKGEARDIKLGEVLRRSSGTNEIGSLIRITIDGSLSANGMALRGNGRTVAEIRSSLAGGAQLSGHVQARADRFLQVLGSAATGAAGGVIDLTLGNVMSVFGDKGGVGIGNLLNAISLVLNRFVNHDNALSGNVEITGGVLTDRNLTLQGNRATGQHRHAHRSRQRHDRHHDQLHARRGAVGALPDRHGPRPPGLALVQCGARLRQRSARHGPHLPEPAACADAQHLDPHAAHSDAAHSEHLRPLRSLERSEAFELGRHGTIAAIPRPSRDTAP